MTLDSLIIETRQRFPHYQDGVFDIHPIEKGGSDRKYYRIRYGADSSLILVKYRVDRGENARFVAIANFLSGIGIKTPFTYLSVRVQAAMCSHNLRQASLGYHRTEDEFVWRKLNRVWLATD